MGNHWQDKLCPYCLRDDGQHNAACLWPDKLAQYKVREAAGENPVVPDGINVMCDTAEDLLEAINGTDPR